MAGRQYTKDGRLRGSDDPNPKKCGAKLRGTDPARYCGQNKLLGQERCKFHGGKSLSGPANPAWNGGRFSKYLPARLVARAREAMEDPELLSLRSEMALCHVRVTELLEGITDGEAGQDSPTAAKAAGEFQAAVAAGDKLGQSGALRRMLRAIAGRAHTRGAWAEIRTWLEQLRKLQSDEVRRLMALQQTVTHEQLVGMIGVLVDIVADVVTDRDQLAQITQQVQARVLARPGQVLLAASVEE